jgi:hypothetical protein
MARGGAQEGSTTKLTNDTKAAFVSFVNFVVVELAYSAAVAGR